jgi:Lar family restriction alleviation protein
MEKLKPCPFCGSENVTLRKLDILRYIECRDCKATGPLNEVRDDRRAAQLWNIRSGAI